jgi:hypothetical protein
LSDFPLKRCKDEIPVKLSFSGQECPLPPN